MSVKMLAFDVREYEQEIFNNEKFQNFDIKLYDWCLNEESIKQIPQDELDNTMVISVFLDSEITENVINSFKNLRIISTRTSSIEHINKNAAAAKNIDIVNVEGYSSRTAAQFTIGLMIALIRNIIPLSKFVEKGEVADYTGYDISKLTIGVVGAGSTGTCVCKIAQAIGMDVLVHDVFEKQELLQHADAKYVDFETLLRQSDVVSLHLPFNTEKHKIITAKELEIMKPGAYLINTSRANLVDINDLYNALINKKIQGAALDIRTCDSINQKCFKLQESLHRNLDCVEEMKTIYQLAKMPNVIITPHVAYKTADVIEYILKTSITGILDCIKGGSNYKAC